MNANITKGKTEISRAHFHNEGERIKTEDKDAIYEVRNPKDLTMQADFGFVRYDVVLQLVDKYCVGNGQAHLDLGCGLGFMMAQMSKRNFKTSGVDISRSFLDIAKEKLMHWKLPFDRLMEADLQKHINLPDSVFDVITSTDVLEHIEKPELFLQQLNRLLKVKGRVVICTNNSLSIWGIEKFIVERILRRNCFHPIDRWWSYIDLKKVLERNGFRVIEMRSTYFFPFSRMKKMLSVLGIFSKRYEMNDWLSKSVFRYFGRDIILVLEKKPFKERSGSESQFSIRSFFKDPHTQAKRYHTIRRIFNLLLTRAQLLLRMPKIWGYPTFLVIEPTNICNLKCPLCPTGQGVAGRPKGKMSFANFKKVIDELGIYLYSVRLDNWGEPLLNEEISEMIQYVKDKNIAVSFNTNLHFFNKEKAMKLILSGVDHIKISLDGVDAKTYLKYRVGGDFDKVIGNIKLLVQNRLSLQKSNPFIEVQFIVMGHNENQISQVKRLCAELGVDGLMIESVRPDMRQELFSADPESIKNYKEWLPLNEDYSKFDYTLNQRKRKREICNYLWTSVVVNWDGAVAPCCSIFEECYDFGNLFKEDFKKVWNGKKYVAARKLIGRREPNSENLACVRCFKYGFVE